MKTARKTVLIIDDETQNIDILIEILNQDYKVIAAKSGPEGLLRARKYLPDIILLDIMMPDMDGYEVCKSLKQNEKTSEIPVIFITVMKEAEQETKGLKAGAIDYITRPLNPLIVKARIKNQLALRDAIGLRYEVERMSRHDMKTPLGVVIGMPQTILDEYQLPHGAIDGIKAIEQAGYNILNLINMSLNLYRMETGNYRLQPTLIDINSILHKIVFELNTQINAKHLEIVIHQSDRGQDSKTGFILLGEELLVYSMLSNLIKNAVEASPENQQITVSLSMDPDKNCQNITIHNKGSVANEFQDYFFNKYSTFGKSGGTGLGTYSAKLIAKTHGGNIWMNSTDSHGTTIDIEFPPLSGRYASPAKIQTEKAKPPIISKDLPKLNILLIEKHPHNHTIFELSLKSSPHQYTAAIDGKSGLARYRQEQFDILFINRELKTSDGYDGARQIREYEKANQLKPVPIIFLTVQKLPGTQKEYIDSSHTQSLLNFYHVQETLTKMVFENCMAMLDESDALAALDNLLYLQNAFSYNIKLCQGVNQVEKLIDEYEFDAAKNKLEVIFKHVLATK